MAGFVATAAPAGDADTLRNDGWFPDLSLATLRDLTRFDGTVTDPRLRDAARYAMAHVNTQLAAYKATHFAAGVADLAAVSAEQLDDESRLVMLYRRAVACSIKADQLERYRNFDATSSAQDRAADMDATIGDQRRNASWAIRDILGQPHSVVELI